MTGLVWLRDDLRLADNPALVAAAHRPLVALYVHDDSAEAPRPPQGAAGWWLSRSLKALEADLARHGVPLVVRRGEATRHVPEVAAAINAAEVHWNRRYDPRGVAIDKAIKTLLGERAQSHHAHLMREPWQVLNGAGQFFKVFTPYWRAHQGLGPLRAPLARPALHGWRGAVEGLAIDALALEPHAPDWAAGFAAHWQPGEAGARQALIRFVDEALPHYATERDRPDREATSRLSPHLRFGEISPFQVAQAAEMRAVADETVQRHKAKFISELGWRDFSHSLLFHCPDMASLNINRAYDAMPWREAEADFLAWCRGMTGYPLVDAGMRELWQTGFMHNRVRMICASFLIKHLMIDWRRGERWFWDCLVDADSANNPASWQWVAGSGADAAPYYRIFNPVLQGEKFDLSGDYTRRFVPELALLPTAYLHKPFAAPAAMLASAGVRLGESYPRPIVDLQAGRARALAAHQSLKSVT